MIPNSGPMVPNGAVPRLIVLGASAVAASHTGDTNPFTFATVTVPANAMGPNGRLRITFFWTTTASGNSKVLAVNFGGTLAWLAADDPEGARAAMHAAMGQWSKQEFHTQHFTSLAGH